MANMEHFRKILASVAERLGVTEAVPDANGRCVLQLPETFVSISCLAEEAELKLAVPVAVISGTAPRPVLVRLLESNLFFKDTRGSTLSYTKANGWVLLHLNLPADAMDEIMFFHAVDNMLKIAKHISQEIAEIMAENGSQPEATNPEPEGQFPAWGLAV